MEYISWRKGNHVHRRSSWLVICSIFFPTPYRSQFHIIINRCYCYYWKRSYISVTVTARCLLFVRTRPTKNTFISFSHKSADSKYGCVVVGAAAATFCHFAILYSDILVFRNKNIITQANAECGGPQNDIGKPYFSHCRMGIDCRRTSQAKKKKKLI